MGGREREREHTLVKASLGWAVVVHKAHGSLDSRIARATQRGEEGRLSLSEDETEQKLILCLPPSYPLTGTGSSDPGAEWARLSAVTNLNRCHLKRMLLKTS